MPKKPTSFEDIVGHKNLVEFLKGHLKNGTLPQFLIFEGDEGLGKSSLAKILALELMGRDPMVSQRVIQENKSTESVLLYNMSVNGGKDTAKEVEANLGLGLSGLERKVIILDEAHAMSDAAQDVFLVSTEYLPMVKEFIDYLDVDDVLPLLSCLASSMTQGLSYISEMKLNTSFVSVLVEILKVKSGLASFKLSMTDTHKVRAQLSGVPVESLTKFIYLTAELPKLTRSGVISAFLQSHVDSKSLVTPPSKPEILQAEMQQKLEAPQQELREAERPAAPSISELLQKGAVLER